VSIAEDIVDMGASVTNVTIELDNKVEDPHVVDISKIKI